MKPDKVLKELKRWLKESWVTISKMELIVLAKIKELEDEK